VDGQQQEIPVAGPLERAMDRLQFIRRLVELGGRGAQAAQLPEEDPHDLPLGAAPGVLQHLLHDDPVGVAGPGSPGEFPDGGVVAVPCLTDQDESPERR